MFDDPHLLASGGLEPVVLPGGAQTMLPTLPIELAGQRTGHPARLADVPDDPAA